MSMFALPRFRAMRHGYYLLYPLSVNGIDITSTTDKDLIINEDLLSLHAWRLHVFYPLRLVVPGIDGAVGGVLRDRGQLRAPTLERIAVLPFVVFCRRLAFIDRHCAVVQRLAIQLRTVLVQEENRILVQSAIKDRRVGRRTGDLRQLRTPAGEDIRILLVLLTVRRLARIDRYLAVRRFRRQERPAVVVLEGHGVLLRDSRESSRIRGIAFRRYDLRAPAGESIVVMLLRVLGRDEAR